LEYAAEVALKAGRTAEALLIAESGGAQLFERIKEEYFSQAKDSYVKLFLRSIVQEDFKEMVSTQALHAKNSNWKELVSYLLSYVEGDELKTLVNELGDELLNKKKDINSAIACFMIAQSTDTVVDLWKKRAHYYIKKGENRSEALFQLFQKCILLKTVWKSTKPLLEMDLITTDIAELMAHEQLTGLAIKYLDISNPRQANVALMRDRIYNSDSFRNKSSRPSIPY